MGGRGVAWVPHETVGDGDGVTGVWVSTRGNDHVWESGKWIPSIGASEMERVRYLEPIWWKSRPISSAMSWLKPPVMVSHRGMERATRPMRVRRRLGIQAARLLAAVEGVWP